MVQQDYTKEWTEVYKLMNKPLMDLTALNMQTFNELSDKSHYESMLNVKNPADLMTAQLKMTGEIGSGALKYAQETFNIWLDTIEQLAGMAASAYKSNVGSNPFAQAQANPLSSKTTRQN